MADAPTGETSESNANPPDIVDHDPAIVAPGDAHFNVLVLTQPTWIEIELVGEDDGPIPGEAYRMKMADGSLVEGVLDESGVARVEVRRKGECVVTFPNLDQDAWARI